MKFTFSYLLHLTSFLRPENLKRKLTVCIAQHYIAVYSAFTGSIGMNSMFSLVLIGNAVQSTK